MTPGDSKSKRLWSIIDCRHCADHAEARSRRRLTGADLQRALSMVPFLGPLLAASEGAILTDALHAQRLGVECQVISNSRSTSNARRDIAAPPVVKRH